MYYHCRDLRHTVYGTITPPPETALDPDLGRAYRWLGQHCGFYPQIWLSRSRSGITGFQRAHRIRASETGLLFGFESIQGFPVDYDLWCEFLGDLMRGETLAESNDYAAEHLEWRSSIDGLAADPLSRTWRETGDLRETLSRHLFQKHDQVVVPRLNLKAAKLVVCRNERQKKALRQMGFIEDRVVIRGRRR